MNLNRISVCDEGAVPNSSELQTAAFQTAIDKAFFNGGGTVCVPAGEYRIGCVRLRSNVTLLLLRGARLIGSRDIQDYAFPIADTVEPMPEAYRTDALYDSIGVGKMKCDFTLAGSRWNRGLIYALEAVNVSIIAEPDVIIDGNNSYDELGEEGYRGAHGISIHYCQNVKLSGYTIQNTGNWAHNISSCHNVSMSDVTVYGGHDGIHLIKSQNIDIAGCRFYTGDDCVAGEANLNTTVHDCIMNTACSGMRFGGTNVLVKNCVFYGPAEYGFRGGMTKEQKQAGETGQTEQRKNMLSMFTYFADFFVEHPSENDNITIVDCTARNTDRFLQYNFFGNERWQANAPLRSITFKNVRAESIALPIYAYGSSEVPVTLTLDKVRVSFREGVEPTALIHAGKFEKIVLDDVSVTNLQDAPLVKCFSGSGEIVARDINGISDDKISEKTHEAWYCKPI